MYRTRTPGPASGNSGSWITPVDDIRNEIVGRQRRRLAGPEKAFVSVRPLKADRRIN